ncbi:adenylyl-sulfate kinase [Bacillus sp. S10(2024)]|uniref:adenylyl-sulfate kinase n=1 Tax=Bacillus sp. S10(2024) TaxID=3162886 RepID=UPI003D2388B5
MEVNVTWHHSSITKEQRRKKNGHRSFVLWFTGLSASGKSTLANTIEKKMFEQGITSYVLDGDNLRHGLNKDLMFSERDRKENIRRTGEVAKLFVDAGTIILAAFISPYREDREAVRLMLDKEDFIEVFVKCSLEECERRDPKKLYKKARDGEIKEFTGVSAPYEEPVSPDIIIETDKETLEESVDKIFHFLIENKYLLADKYIAINK